MADQQKEEVEQTKIKENVKFHTPNDTFNSEDGDGQGDQEQPINEEMMKEAKLKATPAVFKRRQATRHLVVNSPTDHIFSPISQKLLQKKRSNDTIKPLDLNDEEEEETIKE